MKDSLSLSNSDCLHVFSCVYCLSPCYLFVLNFILLNISKSRLLSLHLGLSILCSSSLFLPNLLSTFIANNFELTRFPVTYYIYNSFKFSILNLKQMNRSFSTFCI